MWRGSLSTASLKSEAWIAFDAAIEHRARESMTAILSPMKEITLSPVVYPVNRGYNSVIEAAVHGTRYLWNKDPEIRRLIDHHRSIIRRCGGPRGARGPGDARGVPGEGDGVSPGMRSRKTRSGEDGIELSEILFLWKGLRYRMNGKKGWD